MFLTTSTVRRQPRGNVELSLPNIPRQIAPRGGPETTTVFHRVADAGGVPIHAPSGSSITYFNSPYYGHHHRVAVDLYPETEHGGIALSPVDGEVVKVHTFHAPRSRHFTAPTREQLLLLRARRSDQYIRLLHIETHHTGGETIRVGDALGRLIRSGFFHFWTGPHVHVEVRRAANLLRAKGSLSMLPWNPEPTIEGQTGLAPLTIAAVTREHLLLHSRSILKIGAYSGVGCTVDAHPAILEGGIPHYAHGGVHMATHQGCTPGATVRLDGVPLGRVSEVHGHVATFKVEPVEMRINELPIRGLSLLLAVGLNPLIKAVPLQPGDFQGFHTGETAHLQLTIPF
jgi:hypothetical protein